MARQRTSVNPAALQLLKQYVKFKINLDCNKSSHIQQLQEKIEQATGECLSIQTLNRFFGIISNGFNPSSHTLNTLARYVDYKSFSQLEVLNEENTVQTPVHPSGVGKFVYEVLADIQPEANLEPGILTVIKNTTRIMTKNHQLAAEIYRLMAPNAFGRKYFFEIFINMDALNHEYGEGLRYYLVNAVNREQKFFAYSMHCYKYFLNSHHSLFNEYFNLLNEFRESEILSFHPSMVDRFYAIHLYKQALSTMMETNNTTLVNPLIDFDMLTSNPKSYYAAGIWVGEALLLAGRFDKAWEVLNSDTIKPSMLSVCMQEEFIMQLNILKLVSGFFSGNLSYKRAMHLYDTLQEQPLPPLTHNYFLLYLLLVKHSLSKKTHQQKEVGLQIEQLVKKTGFHYFNQFMQLALETSSTSADYLACNN